MSRGVLQTLCGKGQVERALDVLSCMDTAASNDTYLSLLKACNKSTALTQAKRVHAHLAQHSVQLTGLLGDYMVVTLAKCGAIEDAIRTSSTLPCRTVFSWTAIITAYVSSGCGEEALRMHQCMQEDGVEPDPFTFVSLFQACGSIPDLQRGKQLHVAACWKGFASDVFVGSTLVHMYGKCGAFMEAELVFGALSGRTVVSWSAMLSAYVEQGQGKKALQLYRQMQEEGMTSDQLASMLALQSCGTIVEKEEVLYVERQLAIVMSFEIGRALHADARRQAFTSDVFLGNTLVNMYGKCGAITEAEHVFDALPHHDVVSWNAMLLAYVEHGQGHKALQLYTQIQEEGMSPDHLTTLFAIQACATLAEQEEAFLVEGQSTKVVALKIGQTLNVDACKKGFESDGFVGSSLVKMYGKCGAVGESGHVFCALSHHDVALWNTMLSVYVEQGQGHDTRLASYVEQSPGQKALLLYRQMQKEAVSSDQLTYVLALQACATLSEEEDALLVEGRSVKVMPLEIGKALHADAHRKGFAHDVFVGNTLMSMYSKCGALVEAEHVFCSLSQRTIVSWTAMLSVYIEQGQAQKALQLYTQMQEEGIESDEWTFVLVLQACATLAEKEEALFVEGQSTKVMILEIGLTLHTDIRRKGFACDVFVGSTLVSMYGKCGAIVEAEHAFNALSQCTVVSWTAMLSAYLEQSQGKKALQVYRQMLKQGVVLNYVTLNCVLQACSATGSLETCKQLHFDIVSVGYDWIPSVAATLIHTYGSCASMVDAQAFFDKLLDPDIVLWNACISGHAGEGNFITSLHMFENLKAVGIKPDDVTFTVVLSACSHTGLVSKGLEYFDSMSRDYGLSPHLKHYGSMVDLLGRVGDFKGVETLLGQMPMQADLPIWMCLLGASCTHGNLQLAKHAFDLAVSLQPKEATAYILMSKMYADAGLWEFADEVVNFRNK